MFPLILFTSLSLHSQSPRTQQQQPSAPSSTNNNKASQVEHYYVLLSPPTPLWPASLFLSCPPASAPHRGRDTSTACAVIFSHARLGCDDIDQPTHKCSKWALTSRVSLAALLCWLCVTCVNREGAFHTRSSFTSLAAIVRELNFHGASQLQYTHGKKKRVAFDTSCLW